jgi:hypothetical protein
MEGREQGAVLEGLLQVVDCKEAGRFQDLPASFVRV